MMNRALIVSFLAFAFAVPALAEDGPKPDDSVAFDIKGEDWVTTKTAHVVLDVEASVSAATAGTMRADMIKSVNDAAKGDWRLVSFSRNQDQTGMERWSVDFEARLPENELGGLSDAAKKASKAGMQISVAAMDFSPTLDETETTKAALRTRLFKQAADQLATLNSTLPGRTYRISQITFDTEAEPVSPPTLMHRAMVPGVMAMTAQAPAQDPIERSEKIILTAHVTFSALPPSVTSSH
jgi:hypothetical protein